MPLVAMVKIPLLVLLAAGCAASGEYLYVPAAGANAASSGYPAAYYAEPRDHPTGDVRLATFGLTDIATERGAPAMPVLHVRMIVANNADPAAWSIDTQTVIATIAGGPPTRPALVNTDAGAPPLLQIVAGEQRVIDLYYPLLGARATPEEVPAFDISWQIATSSGLVAERTPFERRFFDDRVRPAYDAPYAGYYGVALGFAPYWWYDPWYGHHGLGNYGFGLHGYGRAPLIGAPHGGFYGRHQGGHVGGHGHFGGHGH